MKIINAIFVFVIAFAVLVSASGVASAAIDDPLRPLSFGSPENLSALNIAKLTGTVPSEEYDVKTISYEIDAAECTIHPVPDAQGYVYLKIGNLKPCTKPGEPQLPMKTFVIKLPRNAEVIGAEMTYGNYREIENELNIVPMPQPVTWSWPEAEEANKYNEEWADKNLSLKKKQYQRYIPDEKVYSLSTYFPGKALSYYVGCDNEYKHVIVRFYPVQYTPAKKKAILITDVEINVYYNYSPEPESFFRNDSGVPAMRYSESENVIITPPELFEQANRLKNFHDNKGIPTAVVNTTWIFSNYGNASDPPYEGYKNSFLPGWGDITGYNYTLAKRTVKYLKDTVEHPNLTYVTLFGNARLVPPSYYIYIAHYDTYNNWIPTDFFYASPDYDLFPNVMVGRLPVSSSAEAEHVVEKIENWDGNVSYDWFKNVSLGGGKPFRTIYYIGELATVDSVNQNYFNGMNVTEFFRTDGNFNKANLTNSLSGDTGILYVFTHGSGDSWGIEGDPINVDDLLSLPHNSRVPVVVSPACMDGAFDTNLYPNTLSGYAQPISFGEGVVLSNASGIAYIGGARVNYGGLISYIDKGNLRITKEPCMQGMLTYVFKAYHEGANSLGRITKEAMKTYLLENDFCAFNIPLDNVTYFEFTLLGDPALQIPAQQAGPEPSYQTPNSSALNPEGYDDEDMPWYRVNENVTIRTTTNSPKVYTKHIIPETDLVLNRIENSTVDNTFDYNFTASNAGYNLIRSASEDKKERWFYLRVLSAWFNDIYSDYGEDTDGNGLYDYLVINVSVNVTEAGDYIVSGNLFENGTYNRVGSDSNLIYLSEGNQTVQLRFKGFKLRMNEYNGTYDLKSLRLSSTGELDSREYAYTTSWYNWTEFDKPPEFNDIYSDYGEDTDGDGLYDYLVINVGVNVTEAGDYEVSGWLYENETHKFVDHCSNKTYLSEGNQTVQLRFIGFKLSMSKHNGTYDLKSLRLSNAEMSQLDFRWDAYTTAWYNWTAFELRPALFNDIYSDYGENTDGDGLYNYFVVNVGVNVTKAGNYEVNGDLYENGTGNRVGDKLNRTYLSKGNQTVQLRFKGVKLRMNEYNGTYDLKSLWLYNVDDELTVDFRWDAYTTAWYNWTEFELPPEFNDIYSDYGEDADGDGLYDYLVVNVGVNVTEAGSYAVSGKLYENGTYNRVGSDCNTTYLSEGNQTVQLRFRCFMFRLNMNKYNGTYDLKELKLSNAVEFDFREYAYTTLWYNWTEFELPPAEFNDIYSDYGEDTDGDGLYDYLVINVGVNVTEAGDYIVGGGLYKDKNWWVPPIDSAWNKTYLSLGNQTVQLRFNGFKIRMNGYNGTYNLIMLALMDVSEDFKDMRVYAYTTSRYNWTEFAERVAEFNDIYSDYGEDTDGDGLYDYLVVNVGVNVTEAGNYTVSGDLCEHEAYSSVDSDSNTTYLREGNQTVQLRFRGFKLRMNKYNGTYDLKRLWLFNAKSEFVDDVYYVYPYTTLWYNWTEFGPPVFDTGPGTYPSIFGTHNGTIKPGQTIRFSKMYTYPSAGTGGHTEYVRIWGNGINVNASWNGYVGDWHNISFGESFTLVTNKTYNYTIRTGSYPQIIHKQNHTTLDGSLITCKEFVATNGNEHDDWIPAFKLFL